MTTSKSKIGNYRWTILALLFFATTINYMDRQILGILAPTLEKEIGWNEVEYASIVVAFQAAYALGLLIVGRLIDKIGTKKGYSLSLTGWSLSAAAHALATSVTGFSVARFFLGLFEAGNFPAAVKTVAEWFPKKERAFATGLFNAGSNVGAIVAPLVVPWLAITYGWQEAFIAVGLIGLIWLIFWYWLYEKPENQKRLSKTELEYIQSDPPDTQVKIPWLSLMKYKQAWGFALAKFLTDPVWWFYLYWIPKFLYKEYGITLDKIGLPLIIIYLMADIGSIGGGWLSSFFIKKGWSITKGRKTAMIICAVLVLPIVFASKAGNIWIAVSLLSLATAAHQGWSANLFTTASDVFPRKAVGSVVGFGGMAGAIGGMLIASIAGLVLQLTGNYLSLFIMAGSMYLIAFALHHFLIPKFDEVKIIEN